MSHAPYRAETREEAYRTWRACGRNFQMAVRELEKKGLRVTWNTIWVWAGKYSWKDRADRADAEDRRASKAMGEAAAVYVADLEKLRAIYTRFFEGLKEGGVDNQATYAFAMLIKTIMDVKKTAAPRPDLYAMTPVVMEAFVRFIKEHATPEDRVAQAAVFALIDRFFDEVKPDSA